MVLSANSLWTSVPNTCGDWSVGRPGLFCLIAQSCLWSLHDSPKWGAWKLYKLWIFAINNDAKGFQQWCKLWGLCWQTCLGTVIHTSASRGKAGMLSSSSKFNTWGELLHCRMYTCFELKEHQADNAAPTVSSSYNLPWLVLIICNFYWKKTLNSLYETYLYENPFFFPFYSPA